ncbi:hypothetical protein OC846_005407 [Tilletia horrida]|uniref:Amidohydrolase-related domain-containing protein n=1 Tax=Tilletia horrida TaxID=155126 RepID=A0AAN6GKX6_9BASI|nr:hypothetical protein OC846_005407 [Tilletia horrida]KAK0561829.1 hypothetical protein OC861_005620 [Tilletia horrida]
MPAPDHALPRRIFIGAVVTPVSHHELTALPCALVGVGSAGTIRFIEDLSEGDDTKDEPVKPVPASALDKARKIVKEQGWDWETCEVVVLEPGSFLSPGFPNIGLGQQYELLDWLKYITFPREARFADTSYAERTFKSVVSRLLSSGTTCACYYATLHLDATKILADVCTTLGQRAFVGKCQMDRHSPPEYCEKSAAQSLQDTKEFISYCTRLAASYAPGPGGVSPLNPQDAMMKSPRLQKGNGQMEESIARLSKTLEGAKVEAEEEQTVANGSADASHTEAAPIATDAAEEGKLEDALVQPILTPRFAISCSDALLAGIGAIATKDPSLRIQTHLSENPSEIEFTRSLFPFADSYTHVYDHFSLLTDRTILAHAVHLTDPEIQLLKQRKCGVSHCPTSNLNLRSGASPVGELLKNGIKVGLGTDVSGGFGIGMLSAVREASVVAKVIDFSRRGDTPSATPGEKSAEPNGVVAAPGAETIKRDLTRGPLPIATLFYLATMGGAELCALEDRIGSLKVGKEFDALLVKTVPAEAPFKSGHNPNMWREDDDTLLQVFEKWLFCGDDREIGSVFVRGRVVAGASPLL